MNTDPAITATIEQITKGLSENNNPPISADTLAWGILALQISGADPGGLNQLRTRLTGFQMGDGRFTLSRELPETYWPTPIALLGLLHGTDFEENRKKALDFLLRSQGRHWEKIPGDPVEHDPSLIGWPWIGNTHSWIIPTSMAIMTLKLCGIDEHPRLASGIQMILNRQLSSGGWNYGNTIVFKSELVPFPECTGYALNALQGFASEEQVAKSLSYLKNRVNSIRTPVSLSWALMGLGAWSQRPAGSEAWIVESLQLQKRYGPYPTSLLSQLVISYYSVNGLYSLLKR